MTKKKKDTTAVVRGARFVENQSDRNRVRVHPWVPVEHKADVLDITRALCSTARPIAEVRAAVKALKAALGV